ncbi:putative transport protein particle (TRAPP) component [Helianthus debilis subsp. tardiflorus]
MAREVSESCVDSLLTEIVSSYCTRLYANKPELAARRIEAIGYQVGHQLCERYKLHIIHTHTIKLFQSEFVIVLLNCLVCKLVLVPVGLP